ncbi:MAG: hypothetical protein R3E65_08005 [Steroidobacteraceae bacterium]
MAKKRRDTNKYAAIVERVFRDRWKDGLQQFEFERDAISDTARKLKIDLPKNLGDVIYSLRYRSDFPESILRTQPKGKEWIIEGAGRAKYRFRLVSATRILPRTDLAEIALPDATPEVIAKYALGDEQALLAIVRYNRLIDTFLGLTTYSLQNHLRTSVRGVGQIEIDELYVGLDRHGSHYIIPVQAKGGRDQIGSTQTNQDFSFADEKFPGMKCRAVAAQFLPNGTVVLFELTVQKSEVKVVDEKHYKLVPSSELDDGIVRTYR